MGRSHSIPRKVSGSVTIYGRLGGNSSSVFRGRFGLTEIAIKIIENMNENKKEKLREYSLFDHENFISVHFSIIDGPHLYLAMDLCEASLSDFLNDTGHPTRMNNPKNVLQDIANGVEYLHNLGLVHGNLHHSNILFRKEYPNGNNWKVKISGMFSPSKWKSKNEENRKNDVRDLASIFYYVLSQGKPLPPEQRGILEGFHIDDSDIFDAKDLICLMAEGQISMTGVKKHPFFWSGAEMVSFFQRLYSYTKDDKDFRDEIDSKAAMIFTRACWKHQIPEEYKQVRDILTKEEEGKKIHVLLRVIRNWSVHYYDARTEVALRKEIGALPDEFAKFFRGCYPKLLSVVYHIVESKKGEVAFRPFYDVAEDDYEEDRNREVLSKPTESSGKSPKQRVIALCRSKGGVHKVKLNDDSSKSEKKKIEVKNTEIVALPTTLTAVAIGCKLFAITWIGYIFEIDFASDTPQWSEKKETSYLHGKYPPAAVVGDRIYICGGGWRKGGYNKEREMTLPYASVKCEVFDIKTDFLHDLCDLKNPCRSNSLVAVEGVLYSIGGNNEEGDVLNTIEKYDTTHGDGGEWEVIKETLSRGKKKCTSVALPGKIIIFGGKPTNEGTHCMDIEEFSVERKQCTLISQKMPTIWGKFTACVHNSKIYVLGRKSRSQKFAAELSLGIYDDRTGNWKTIKQESFLEPICASVTL